MQAGPGQLDPKELVQLYRFREITAKTKIFAVTGYPLTVTDSPRYFNTAFKLEQIDAVYIPIPADSIGSLMNLAQEVGISGISVTVPFKEDVLPYLAYKSEEVTAIGACNTVVAGPQGWVGYNTDASGFSGSLLSFIDKKDFRGRKITIVGAGGAAKAVAAEVFRLRGKALILNRTGARARSLAEPYRFMWAGFDSRGTDLIEKYSDIIIQTSSVGMGNSAGDDPLEFYKFSGRETVMDLIYKPDRTNFLRRAEEAGCRVLGGHDMLLRQFRHRYMYFMNKEFPPSLISRVR
jgi:3-dehydroquinate dehydratase/shikimate dehydrogenase